MNRREFFLGTLSTSALFLSPKWLNAATPYVASAMLMDAMAPLQTLDGFRGSNEIEGDTHDEAHEIFWNKDGFIQKKGGIPAVSAEYDVVVVGGGLAGMVSTYHLPANMKVLMIDGHPRMGGNAKSQRFNNAYASQGSAYITLPEEDGEVDVFLKDLKIKNKFRLNSHEDEVITMNGKFKKGFWQGATDPAHAEEFERVAAKMADVYENSYPDIPWYPGMDEERAIFNANDHISFKEWVTRELGVIHPHVAEYLTQYCWSSFSASWEELSASQALNFITCDMDGIQVLPGGNGMMAQAMFEQLSKRKMTMRAPAFAVDIKPEGGSVRVCFKNEKGQLESIRAKKCVAASPKMVLKHVISDLSTDQTTAMKGMGYRAYMVANVFLKKKIPSPAYDVFALHGKVPTSEYEDSKSRVFADITFADWAMKDVAEKTILTLYIPLPYDMAQQYLFVPNLYEKYYARVQEKLLPSLVDLGLSWGDVEGMRLVRYGHALPVAQRSGVKSGLFERAHADIDGCIHFAHQDNWGNPCFETSFAAGMLAARKIKGEA